MTSVGNIFNDFSKNQLIKFRAQRYYNITKVLEIAKH